jgi:thymidylate synthase ThyX
MAQPEMRITAELMRDAMAASTPRMLAETEWHVPFVTDDDEAALEGPIRGSFDALGQRTYDATAWADCLAISVARCARASFDRALDVSSVIADRALHDTLTANKHWSPLEHQAQVQLVGCRSYARSNFRRPWVQYRKTWAGEAG